MKFNIKITKATTTRADLTVDCIVSLDGQKPEKRTFTLWTYHDTVVSEDWIKERIESQLKQAVEATLAEREREKTARAMIGKEFDVNVGDEGQEGGGEAEQRFLMLRRALKAFKDGGLDGSALLHFMAGFCGYVPKSEEEMKW